MANIRLHIGKMGSEALRLLDKGFHFERVSEGQALTRLSICDVCEFRKGKQCGVCGCELDFKARLATNPTKIGYKKTQNKCPKGRW
jgi:hypothetical protein